MSDSSRHVRDAQLQQRAKEALDKLNERLASIVQEAAEEDVEEEGLEDFVERAEEEEEG